ncbi:MAG: aminoacyl-tRNA deacylase [Candidatus Nanopelagicales bacterium]|nr:aminoacyl-tRNA deacylase [Candidatus Nanopelagicales bacterium]
MATSSATPATSVLDALGYAYQVHRFDSTADRHFGEEAAIAMGTDPLRVFKTIVFSAGNSFVIGVSPISWDISPKKLAHSLGLRKLEPASISDSQRVTGYVVGGISPLGQKKSLPTAIDSSAWNHQSIFISGGRRGLEIEIPADHLQAALQAIRAPIAANGASTSE